MTPQKAGLPDNGRRRSPGLRREELATLAGLSFPYYTRLEQGRDRKPSPQVIAALGSALRLDEQGLTYLARMAGLTPGTPRGEPEPELVRPSIRTFVEQAPGPTILVGRYRDVLDANRLAETLHVGYQPGQNLLRFLFFDPQARQRVITWEAVAETATARLRIDTSARTDDIRLRALVDELSADSEEFRTLWRSHAITVPPDREFRFNNPHVGPITVYLEQLAIVNSPGQTLNLAYARPNSTDAAALARLSRIAADTTPKRA